ncbi:LOW QUALITY PROTEIN: hypothetical protein TorRG33x02_245240 [Trema orientale]|uniref:Uncharacterized protein n=1 Tax=Trema orientale TaxID=63057 RepID=A0A2P5DQ77_TREOI|nr:LOW QUALITY PROTEIN: hypothetical protein TorRG33x02_245240 [Trema orientale]
MTTNFTLSEKKNVFQEKNNPNLCICMVLKIFSGKRNKLTSLNEKYKFNLKIAWELKNRKKQIKPTNRDKER